MLISSWQIEQSKLSGDKGSHVADLLITERKLNDSLDAGLSLYGLHIYSMVRVLTINQDNILLTYSMRYAWQPIRNKKHIINSTTITLRTTNLPSLLLQNQQSGLYLRQNRQSIVN